MTSNIVTLPGRTSKAAQDAVPKFSPKLALDADERAAFYALSHADEIGRLGMVVARAEGPNAALDMLDNVKSAIKSEFKIK